MKAEIDANGQLIVTPENEIESYALKKWNDSYLSETSVETLLIVSIVEDKEYKNDKE